MEIINQVLKKIDSSDISENGELIIPEGILTIDEFACYNIPELKSVKISDSVTEILKSAFNNCSRLEEIEFSNNLTYLGRGAFENCSSLKNVIIPDSVLTMGEYAFGSCDGLEEIELGSKIKEIPDFLLNRCKLLKKVKIKSKVKRIGSFSFSNCSKLERIELPISVEEIGKYAFASCEKLKDINFPKSLKFIDDSAFYFCRSLTSITLNEELEKIAVSAFGTCSNLEKIHLPSNLKSMDKDSFNGSHNIKEISTIWGIEKIDDSVTKTILMTYLYLYANHLVKEKYRDIKDFLSNKDIDSLYKEITGILFNEDSIEKFKNLFSKLRKTYDIDSNMFKYLKQKTTEEFSFSIWNDIKDIIPWREYFMVCKSFAEMIETFGIFHKDKKEAKRIEMFKKAFDHSTYELTEESYQDIIKQIPYLKNRLERAFKKQQKKYYLYKNNGIKQIPKEFQVYLKDTIDEEDFREIKKITGSYGKKINDFVKENYIESKEEIYVLKKEYQKDKWINDTLFKSDLLGHLNYHSLIRMFDSSKQDFNEDFYNFLLDNWNIILDNDLIQMQVSSIRDNFPNMKNHYLYKAGIKKISLRQAIDYINEESFDYHNGCYEFQKEAQRAGVVDQETFDHYQEIYEQSRTRSKRVLIPRSNIYEIDGYIIKAELLRKDDPLTILVGENNYTNCCQVYDGVGHNCMMHAVFSDDGGIFVTRLFKDGEWILLTESWDWQNNNVYCHDNIETTNYLKKGSKSLKAAVRKVFEFDANWIIEKSNQEVDRYIKKQEKQIKRLNDKEKEEELKRLYDLQERAKIKVVTVGSEYDDLELESYILKSININKDLFEPGKTYKSCHFQPVNYNSTKPYFNNCRLPYSDAETTQYIMGGDLEELTLKEDKVLEPIYRDERKIYKEEKEQIRDYTINKIQKIGKSAYPAEMYMHQSYTWGDYCENSTVYLGEDWYLIYENLENGNIYISDLARINPDLEDERGAQQQEILSTLSTLLNTTNQIEAVLKEDTSYMLYLMNKRLGYIEQIGEDITYPFDDDENAKIVTERKQEEILESRKKSEDKNKKIMMHKITFKRS